MFLVFFVAAAILCRWLASALIRGQQIVSQTALLGVSSVAGLAAVCAATWLMMSLLEHQPFWACGLAVGQHSRGEMVLGLAGGTGLVGIITMVEWAVGAIHFEASGTDATSVLAILASGTGVVVIAAASEELLFRGYPFQRLVEGTNGTVALGISSVLFGGLHMANPHATASSVANTMLAGVLLSLTYLKTRALWLPIGFHFSWNWTLALLGLPVSGIELIRMPWQAVPVQGRIWLHGGDYGPEGGLVATGALMAGVLFLIRMENRTAPLTDSASAPSPSCDGSFIS